METLADKRSRHERAERKLIAYEKGLILGSAFAGGYLVATIWLAQSIFSNLVFFLWFTIYSIQILSSYLPHRQVASTQLAIMRQLEHPDAGSYRLYLVMETPSLVDELKRWFWLKSKGMDKGTGFARTGPWLFWVGAAATFAWGVIDRTLLDWGPIVALAACLGFFLRLQNSRLIQISDQWETIVHLVPETETLKEITLKEYRALERKYRKANIAVVVVGAVLFYAFIALLLIFSYR